MKLFAVYLGGRAPRSNIELHDVVFVAGTSLVNYISQLFMLQKIELQATQKARKELCVGMIQSHLDDHLEVEGLVEFGKFDVDDILEAESVDGYHLMFTPCEDKRTSFAKPGYIKLKIDETEIA